MASFQYFSFRKLLLLFLVSFLFTSILVCALSETDSQSRRFLGRRKMLEMEEGEEEQPKKKTKPNLSTKNQTKLIKPKLPTNSTKKPAETTTLTKNLSKKLNSTTKSSNSTKPKSTSLKKDSDLLKPTIPKNKTSQLIVTKKSQTLAEKKSSEAKSKTQDKLQSGESKSKTSDKKQPSTIESKSGSPPSKKQSSTESKSKSSSSSSSSSKEQSSESKSKSPDKKQLTEEKSQQKKKIQKPTRPYWMDQDEDDDLVLEFRDLPSKFHQQLIPDLQRISTNSRAYLVQANKEITKGFKPLVGNKYAPTIASILSCVFILVPLLLVSLIFNRIKAYFSLQKILIFIQVYLSIYFTILSLSSLVTGLEPLKFFYATSQSSYVCLQVLQTLGYVLYLLLLLMYLILVFSTENGLGSKLLGLGQTMVGVAVGLHYYATVFHRAVLHQPPKTNWKVHGIYAVCFLVICLFSNAERRKKAYLHDGGEEGKKS
ncbi:uncharacterized protein F59B10.2-like [Macadamia integrifolia]|uniref:uncharacterized protein F59B10.2-like n=1 Tax=Macadamia integrifolia TaxID=60698 RepID=UPI001C4EBA2F|nr:uncharacterized protein F59B10.2-like [Macadamia integrifolia]